MENCKADGTRTEKKILAFKGWEIEKNMLRF